MKIPTQLFPLAHPPWGLKSGRKEEQITKNVSCNLFQEETDHKLYVFVIMWNTIHDQWQMPVLPELQEYPKASMDCPSLDLAEASFPRHRIMQSGCGQIWVFWFSCQRLVFEIKEKE